MEMKNYMYMLIIMFVVSAILVIYPGAWATTYYVDATNGDDSNQGTSEDAPWKSMSKVNSSSFQSGNFILFKRGETWREMLVVPSSGSAEKHITIGAYGTGNRPIIKGSDLVSGWTIHNGNIWKATLLTESSFNQVFFDGTRGNKQTLLGNLNNEKDWYWSSNTLYVYSISDPDTAYVNPGIEVSVRNQCIKVVDHGYITIQDFHLSQGIYDCLLIWDSREFSISRVLAEKSYKANILTGDGSVTISNCEACYSDSEHGIYLGRDAFSSTIEYCHLHHNSQEGIQINAQHGYVDEKTSGMIIRYNHIHNNRNGMGLHAMSESEIYGNIVYNNVRSGIGFWDHDSGPGFGCTNNTVYNNTIFVPVTNDRVASGISARHFSDSNTYKNNIICVLDSNARNWYIDSTSNIKNTIDNNLSYRGTGDNVAFLAGTNRTWVEWQALGFDINGIYADPLFISISPSTDTEFILQSISPCRDAGTNVGLIEDYFGKPIFNAPDIGFYEIQN